MILTEYEVVNESPIIHTYLRGKDGKRVVETDKNFKPYFYIPRNEKHKLTNNKNVLFIEDVSVTDIHGEMVSKVFCKLPKYVKELRGVVSKSYEADILYPTRYTIDMYNDIPGVPISVVYLDIEINVSSTFPNVMLAQEEITAITCFNNINKKCITFVWRADLKPEKQDNGLVSFLLNDEKTYSYNDYTIYFNNERYMLTSFLKYMTDVDCDLISGWNVKQFDMMYIINRMNNLGMNSQQLSPMNVVITNEYKDVVVKGRIIFDMLEAYRRMQYGELNSYRLDNVAYEELGERKIKVSGGLGNLWRNDLKTFIAYNKKDVMLVYRIQRKKRIIQYFDEIRRLSKCSFNDVFNNSRVVDAFVLSFCKGKYVLPTKVKNDKTSYGGGKVLTPQKGIHEWISVFDYKALYPKIISCLNASPETLVPERTNNTTNLRIPYVDEEMITKNSELVRVKETFDKFFETNWDIEKQDFKGVAPGEIKRYIKYKEVHFLQDKKGFIPEILEFLIDERIKVQKERDKFKYGDPEYERLEYKQYSLKVLCNSFYGVLGFHGFRLFEPSIAASITYVGRNSILWSRKIAKQQGYDVIAGDTDSIFVKLKEGQSQMVEESNKIAKTLQDSYDEFTQIYNIAQNYLVIEFEKVYKKIFFGQAKKRYAGRLAHYKGKAVDKVTITGFEVVRSDQSKLARSTQKKVLKMLLSDDSNKKDIIGYLKSIINSIKNDKYDYETIGIPTPLNKSLSEYKTNIPVVRGVMYSNRHLVLDIRPGEKFLLLYVIRIPGKPDTDVIAVRKNGDVPDGTVIDYNKHRDEATRDKMRAIFDGLGWSLLELTGQKSVMDF